MRIIAAVPLLVAGCSTIFGLDEPVLSDAGGGMHHDGAPRDELGDGLGDGAADGPGASGCPPSYSFTHMTSRYRRIVAQMTWANAAQACASDMATLAKHTHLVVMADEAERSALAGMGGGPTWSGLTDLVTEGTYRWVTTEPTSGYPPASGTPWVSSEPDNVTAQNCVAITIGGLFFDTECSTGLQALCECDGYANDPTLYTP